MGGVELAAILKRTRPETKMIFMSGGNIQDKSHVLNPLLQKPFSAHTLISKIREMLGDLSM